MKKPAFNYPAPPAANHPLGLEVLEIARTLSGNPFFHPAPEYIQQATELLASQPPAMALAAPVAMPVTIVAKPRDALADHLAQRRARAAIAAQNTPAARAARHDAEIRKTFAEFKQALPLAVAKSTTTHAPTKEKNMPAQITRSQIAEVLAAKERADDIDLIDRQIAQALGTTEETPTAVHDRNVFSLKTMTPDQARKRLATLKGARR